MNRNVLIAELSLPAYSGLTDQECLDLLQAKNITVKQDISAHDIQKYLALKGKLIPLENSVSPSAISANRMLELFDLFTISEPAVEVALTATLDALILDTLIDATDKAVILSMGEKQISRADELGLGVFGIGAIIDARS